jgi:hypothetical protein
MTTTRKRFLLGLFVSAVVLHTVAFTIATQYAAAALG